MSLDPLAVRVARRHAAVVFRDVPTEDIRIEYSDSGRISAVALSRMLERELGPLVTMRFRRSLVGTPNTVAWEALNERAELVSGKLELHAGVRDDEVVSWAEVFIDPQGRQLPDGDRAILGGADPTVRLRHVERLTRALINNIQKNPQISVVDLVAGLVQIAQEAHTTP
ncbi:MAG: hypothetical protein ABSF69_17730 [Polyangiaceae bacterium]|jgi:hypothetical protein